MAESRETSEILWFSPEKRGIIPLDHIHIPRRFARSFRKHPFRVSFNTAFEQVIDGCSGAGCDRETTWINQPLKDIYIHLHKMGFCHSIEIWQGDMLVGGLYGVAIGAAFFGESMFSRVPNASKIALVYLLARLKSGQYTLLDTQFITDHLKQFGAIEIPKQTYLKVLEKACAKKGDFFALTQTLAADRVLTCIMRDMHNS
jgi:leucyl/phenylalanyl-tRNA--protein transferase